MSLPIVTKIQGIELNPVQQAYLQGLFSALHANGPSPASPTFTEEEAELIFEERVKRELHPLDALHLLIEKSKTGAVPERENIFRFKWHGLFYLTPVKDSFMARLRIPAGQLTSYQVRELAKIGEDLTSGYLQVTTRANLQMRLIPLKEAPEFLRRIQKIGLHAQGAGADNVRNITASPTAGIDSHEWIDVSPFCHELAHLILTTREFSNLPRKFNVAFEGGGKISVVEETNDIGWTAVRHPGNEKIPGGIYFRVKLGGATGHEAIARDAGILVPPAQVVDATAAMIRVFIKHGNRSDRKKARLKHLLETWGIDRFVQESEKLMGGSFARSAPEECQWGEPPLEHSHLGCHRQKQPGLSYLGVAMPVGQISTKQLRRIGEIAELYGSGEVRLTVWQNLIIPNIPDAFLETAKKAIVKAGLDWKQSTLRRGLVACTGNSYCKFASANTKNHALQLANQLEKKFTLDQPINIHLTGCSHSCAQHYIGDIGLLATKVKVAGESVEGYHVFVGGGYGNRSAIGRQIFTGISFEQLGPTLEKMIAGYLANRSEGENFQSFTQRHDLNSLQVVFS